MINDIFSYSRGPSPASPVQPGEPEVSRILNNPVVDITSSKGRCSKPPIRQISFPKPLQSGAKPCLVSLSHLEIKRHIDLSYEKIAFDYKALNIFREKIVT